MHGESEESRDAAAPPPYVPSPPPPLPVTQFVKEVFNLASHVELPLNGFTTGNRIRVVLQPMVNHDGKFSVNLKNRNNDILLHFNPRMKEKVVVFNTCNGGKWYYEERLQYLFPFQRWWVYTIDFTCSGRNSVYIYLNGQFLYEFRERQDAFKLASSVEVTGDIAIHSIHII